MKFFLFTGKIKIKNEILTCNYYQNYSSNNSQNNRYLVNKNECGESLVKYVYSGRIAEEVKRGLNTPSSEIFLLNKRL